MSVNRLTGITEVIVFILLCVSWAEQHIGCKSTDIFCDLVEKDESTERNRTITPEDAAIDDDFKRIELELLHENMSDYVLHKTQDVTDDDEEVRTSCETEKKVFMKTPALVYADDGNWKELHENQTFIITPIIIERCMHMSKICSNLINIISNEASTECEQKYINIPVTLKDSTELNMKIPSACVCVFKKQRFIQDTPDPEKYSYKII